MQMIRFQDIILIMVGALFLLGVMTMVMGIFVLVGRAVGKHTRTIAAQTTRLAQKGITDNVAGLVGNATALLEATQKLVRTTAGIGVFLTVLGLALIGSAYWLLLQIQWSP